MARVEWNSEPFFNDVNREAANRMRDAVVLCTEYAKRNMRHMSPSPPRGFPGIDTSTLRRAIGYDIEVSNKDVTGRFGVLETEGGGKPLDYAYYLEIGTPRMGARPWLTLTLDGTMNEVKRTLGVA